MGLINSNVQQYRCLLVVTLDHSRNPTNTFLVQQVFYYVDASNLLYMLYSKIPAEHNRNAIVHTRAHAHAYTHTQVHPYLPCAFTKCKCTIANNKTRIFIFEHTTAGISVVSQFCRKNV